MAFTYITNWAEDMYTKILMRTKKQRENEKKSHELRTKSFELQVKRMDEFEPIPLSTRLTEEQKKKQEYLDNLEKQAKNLTKEAEGLLKEAQEMEQRGINISIRLSKCKKSSMNLLMTHQNLLLFLYDAQN